MKTSRLLLGTALVGAHWLLQGLPAAQAEIYQYIDANGTISLTNVPTDLRYRRIATQPNRLHPVLSERELEPMISRYSRRHQLHPALIRAVIKAESGFDPMAVSRAGAIGLMQLMPQTAIRLEVRDLYDPEDNIGGGTKYLRQLLDRFRGNLPLALAAYNAGEHTVDRYRGLPPIDETRQYVRKVIRYYRTFLIKDGAMTGRVLAAAESAAPQPLPASLPTSAQ
ncbi:lytic transglycosylase domain-containing protein [Nitrospira lenta]|uniref:lytic transglycosylase domain-containing protein n=1 Tax=Nitrospira lenta TaxID=1436998 RepID=UPI002482F8BA|nr:lytic transglycosylase domain-containing protein [Nitrospira lenta]